MENGDYVNLNRGVNECGFGEPKDIVFAVFSRDFPGKLKLTPYHLLITKYICVCVCISPRSSVKQLLFA